MELPQPRSDGLCVDCEKRPSETNDGRFCRPCLRKRIDHENPISSIFSDMRGRKCRSPYVIGGQPTTNDSDDLVDNEFAGLRMVPRYGQRNE